MSYEPTHIGGIKMKYEIQGIEHTKENLEDYSCKYCGVNISDKGIYLREDACGGYFCENEECVWEHVMECELIELEVIK